MGKGGSHYVLGEREELYNLNLTKDETKFSFLIDNSAFHEGERGDEEHIVAAEGDMDSQNLTNDNIELERIESSSTKWLMYTTGRGKWR